MTVPERMGRLTMGNAEDGNERDIRHERKDDGGLTCNELRLSVREWIVGGIVVVAALGLLPILWERTEEFLPGEDYRIPYRLSNDYWLFDRYSRRAGSEGKVLVIGDSVIWGHYVKKEDTLSGQLNRLAGGGKFANMGVDGIHPAALAGLLEYYGKGISNGRVILHCNLLWMASEKHDLQTSEPFHFNHPKLVPQFVPDIPSYAAPYSQRLGVLAERLLPFRKWAEHLRVAYFDGVDIPAWTVQHPYEDPVGAVLGGLPSPADRPRRRPVPWTARGSAEHDFPWVELSGSLQWRSFRRAVETLRSRNNAVFVLVGPFNEHMLTEASLARYSDRKGEVEAWLRREKIAYYSSPVLPSAQFADASHPLADGYAMLAGDLWRNESFTSSILPSNARSAQSLPARRNTLEGPGR